MNRFRTACWHMRRRALVLLLLAHLGCVQSGPKDVQRIEIRQERFTSVRFDPSYYYDAEWSTEQLCEKLAQRWAESGVNVVYLKAYDPGHGAVYRTAYPCNVETDYGRLDLLRAMLNACHRQDIRVYAWIPAFQHKHAWEAHPDWRVKSLEGSDYQPTSESYFLCVRTPPFGEWWMGFVADLVSRYQDLDGVDIAEPIVAWKAEEGCYCALCGEALKREGLTPKDVETQTFGLARSAPLTSLLERTSDLIHSHGMSVSMTTVATPHEGGLLLSPEEQRGLTGFDLDAVLDSTHRPDIINVELIWQQWADLLKGRSTFSPGWTEQAARGMALQVGDRADLAIHVELTPFGEVGVASQQFLASIQAALDAGAWGIDFYDSYQADKRDLWPEIKAALGYVPVKRVAVYFDPDGENDARQLEVLLRHFHTERVLIPVGEPFALHDAPQPDVVFYLGEARRESLPPGLVRHLSEPGKTVCWLNYNLEHLGKKRLAQMGLEHEGVGESSRYDVLYKGDTFPKRDPFLNLIAIRDPDRCRVLATARSSEEQEFPYVVRSGSFWYFADLPSSYVTEGGCHVVFADLLHNILKEDHQESHLALVRIEDVNPESDPKSLRSIADLLGSKHIPFCVGVTPFYLDPATNSSLSLAEKPEVVKALHHMVSKGGTMVLHGCTHQYRGQTTVDYEFWDGLSGQPIFQDSKEYVRDRIAKALDQCFSNGLYPLAWETPHYAASLLDYAVVNQFFTTSYERRQTMDVLGTDQILPFFIPAKGGEAQLVPENLGYIPTSDPSADKIVECARQNLAVRDGCASFFFHPFVPLDALEQAVEGIEALGYSFADVRTLSNRVVTPSQAIVTGRGEFSLALNDQHLDEFYLTPEGKVKKRAFSEGTFDGTVTREVVCPPRWTYVARAADEKKPNLPSGMPGLVAEVQALPGRVMRPQQLEAEHPPLVPLVLLDPGAEGELSLDQRSFLSAFESVGIDCEAMPVSEFLEIPQGANLVVVPCAAARKLTEQQALFIVGAVSKGMGLVLEKESDLSARVGVTSLGEEKSVSSVRDEYYPQVDIHWKESGTYRSFEVPIEYVTYCSEKDTGDPVVIGGEYGDGKYLYLATLFDPTTPMGYGRYPYFLDLIQRQFGLWPLVRRDCAEVYFEPGDREDVSIEDLVKAWKKSGFRTIYVAGWHTYAQWTYDYARLIELAHENAMLVYLWLELPHVGEKFWDEHPEWRERTATGREAIVDWRRLMALTDESCREAVFSEIAGMIQQYDWDGVNLAELYFESPLGPDSPDILTPMHESVRADFASLHGFDPIRIFDPSSSLFWKRNAESWERLQEYRKGLVVQLHRQLLSFLHDQRAQKDLDMEIMVTVVDNILAKETGEGTAMDTRRLVPLIDELPFSLQVEDPQQLWHLGPSRYEELSRTYRGMHSEGTLIFDINIVPYRELETSLAPTPRPTGIELSQLLGAALQDSNRVALYSESSIYEVDLPWIAYALGRNAKEELSSRAWKIQSRSTVMVDLDAEAHGDILVDGRLWPGYHNGKAILPSGTHTIEPVGRMQRLANTLRTTARLADISGELVSCEVLARGIEVSYTSLGRSYLVVSEAPKKVLVDGGPYEPEILHGIPGFSLKLPAGSHTVRILTSSGGAFSLRNVSIIASALIVLLSFPAGSVLLVLYLARFRRQRRARRLT